MAAKVRNKTPIKAGDRFVFAGFNWVCLDPFANLGDGVLAIMAEPYEDEDGRTKFKFDENGCCDYRRSSLRTKLITELVPRLGADNLIPRDMDLIADTGDDALGFAVNEPVSIMSCDEYRKYRKLIPEWDCYVWTCTPWRIDTAGYAYYVRICDAGDGGALNGSGAYDSRGVAPLVIFKSSIFQSRPIGCEDAAYEVVSDEELTAFMFS